MRQRQIVKKILHELFAGDAKFKIVLAHAVRAGAAARTAARPAALRARNHVAAHVLAVAGIDALLAPASAVAKHRLGDIAARQRDVLALLNVMDVAPGHGSAHRLPDLLAVALQKALAVADGLVLARQAPVNDLLEHAALLVRNKNFRCSCAP